MTEQYFRDRCVSQDSPTKHQYRKIKCHGFYRATILYICPHASKQGGFRLESFRKIVAHKEIYKAVGKNHCAVTCYFKSKRIIRAGWIIGQRAVCPEFNVLWVGRICRLPSSTSISGVRKRCRQLPFAHKLVILNLFFTC